MPAAPARPPATTDRSDVDPTPILDLEVDALTRWRNGDVDDLDLDGDLELLVALRAGDRLEDMEAAIG